MLISNVLRSKGDVVERIRFDEMVGEAVCRLSRHGGGALVVDDHQMQMVGIFSEQDVMDGVAREGAAVLLQQVSELMSSCAMTCSSMDRIDTILTKMTTARIRHLPVIEEGQLVGIVSNGDLRKLHLEETWAEKNVLMDVVRFQGTQA